MPWRPPTVAVLYSTADLDLRSARLVPAEGPADASVIVRTVGDPRLFGPSDLWPSTVDRIPLVDPIQQWWDLHDLDGSDRVEAADRFRQAILDRRLPTGPSRSWSRACLRRWMVASSPQATSAGSSKRWRQPIGIASLGDSP